MTSDQWLQIAGFAVTLVTVILGYLSTRGKVAQVHTLVNSQHDDLVNRTTQLTTSMTDAGIKVPPPNPSPTGKV